MTYTQAQIDKANAVDLEKFLRAQGETLVRSGKEYRWKAHDSLTVCGNKWFRHSQSKGGFPVDFVMEFYGKSFPEAVQMLTGEPGEVQPEADPAPSPAFRLPLRNVTNANILNYLTQERKLKSETLSVKGCKVKITYAPADTDCLDAIQKLLQTTILRTAGHTAA